MGKNAKGHSSKKRHPGVGVPAHGVGTTKERKMARKGRVGKTAPEPCGKCGGPLGRVLMVPSAGPSRTIMFCGACGC